VFYSKLRRITDTLHEDREFTVSHLVLLYSIFTVSHSVLLRMRNASDKSCTENQNTNLYTKKYFQKLSCIRDTV
jgi:hypothetical protein